MIEKKKKTHGHSLPDMTNVAVLVCVVLFAVVAVTLVTRRHRCGCRPPPQPHRKEEGFRHAFVDGMLRKPPAEEGYRQVYVDGQDGRAAGVGGNRR